MRFELTEEQRGFAESLDDLLSKADTPSVIRAWRDGDSKPGLDLWRRLAETGVTGLLVPEDEGGLDASPVDVCVAFEALGRHAVPGPWVESAAFAARALGGGRDSLAAGEEVVTVAPASPTPRALDADVADRILVVDDGLRAATVGDRHTSVDPARRLFSVSSAAPVSGTTREDVDAAHDLAVLACSAQLLGLGEHLLEESVDYAKTRTQFGRPIGSFQALKHALADVKITLEFARPLVYGAAVERSSTLASAAKVAVGDAAYLAARVALQVHGAIGYTAEHDLSLWILKVRALVGAWGTSSYHRGRIFSALEA